MPGEDFHLSVTAPLQAHIHAALRAESTRGALRVLCSPAFSAIGSLSVLALCLDIRRRERMISSTGFGRRITS